MKTIFNHIEHIKGKPHHIRKKVAFAAAGGGAALIGFVWLAASLGTGAFAIAGSSFGDQASSVTAAGNNDAGINNLAGVAAGLKGAPAPAHIEVIGTASSTPPAARTEQTTLPF